MSNMNFPIFSKEDDRCYGTNFVKNIIFDIIFSQQLLW